jgi:opacity protein-like surface antigen
VTVKANSPGVAFGGGVQIFFTPKFALDLGLNYALGSFSEWTANGISVPLADLDATSANVRIGVRFWPSNR